MTSERHQRASLKSQMGCVLLSFFFGLAPVLVLSKCSRKKYIHGGYFSFFLFRVEWSSAPSSLGGAGCLGPWFKVGTMLLPGQGCPEGREGTCLACWVRFSPVVGQPLEGDVINRVLTVT